MTGLIQLLLPPLFIRNYGYSAFGLWVLIYSIGNILSTCDFGWTSSLSIIGIQHRAKKTHSSFNFVLKRINLLSRNLSCIVLILSTFVLALSRSYGATQMSGSTFMICLAAIISTSCLIRMKGLEAIFRANGSTLGLTLFTSNHLCNLTITLLLVSAKIELFKISLAIAISSIMLVLVSEIACRFHLKNSGIQLSLSNEEKIEDATWANALRYFSFPSSYLILNEGINIVVASVLGTGSLGKLAFIRTYVGLFRQITTLFTDSYMPSLAEFLAADKNELASQVFLKLKRNVYSLNFTLLIFFLYIINFTGFLLKPSQEISVTIFVIFCISALCDVPWNVYFVIPSAINNLRELAPRFFLGSLLTIVVSLFLSRILGLSGVAIALIIPDIFMTFKIRKIAQNILNKA